MKAGAEASGIEVGAATPIFCGIRPNPRSNGWIGGGRCPSRVLPDPPLAARVETHRVTQGQGWPRGLAVEPEGCFSARTKPHLAEALRIEGGCCQQHAAMPTKGHRAVQGKDRSGFRVGVDLRFVCNRFIDSAPQIELVVR